jgi:hypothetical protein
MNSSEMKSDEINFCMLIKFKVTYKLSVQVINPAFFLQARHGLIYLFIVYLTMLLCSFEW